MSCQHDAGEGSLCRDENNKDVFIFSIKECCHTSVMCVCVLCEKEYFKCIVYYSCFLTFYEGKSFSAYT